MEIQIPRSKIAPIGEGQICVVPYGHDTLCAVKALKVWLEESGVKSGSVFRSINRHGHISDKPLSADSVNVILKNLAQKCELEQYNAYRGHSLRRGFVTSAIKKGASVSAVMKQGRWKDIKTVMRYYEEVQRFEDNAASLLMMGK